MNSTLKPIGSDAVSYSDRVKAVKGLLNQYPGLETGDVVAFESIGEEGGLGFSADAGALVYKKDVQGNQQCSFPFFIIYRTSSNSERLKMEAHTFLDSFGEWLNDMQEYPEFTERRKITGITATNPYAIEPNENGSQDWLLPVTIEYQKQAIVW